MEGVFGPPFVSAIVLGFGRGKAGSGGAGVDVG